MTYFPLIHLTVFQTHEDSLTVKSDAFLLSNGNDDNNNDYDNNYVENYRGCPKNWQFLTDVCGRNREIENFGRLKLPPY